METFLWIDDKASLLSMSPKYTVKCMSITFTGARRTPPRKSPCEKFPLVKLPRGKFPLVKLMHDDFPSYPRGKVPRGILSEGI